MNRLIIPRSINSFQTYFLKENDHRGSRIVSIQDRQKHPLSPLQIYFKYERKDVSCDLNNSHKPLCSDMLKKSMCGYKSHIFAGIPISLFNLYNEIAEELNKSRLQEDQLNGLIIKKVHVRRKLKYLLCLPYIRTVEIWLHELFRFFHRPLITDRSFPCNNITLLLS